MVFVVRCRCCGAVVCVNGLGAVVHVSGVRAVEKTRNPSQRVQEQGAALCAGCVHFFCLKFISSI